MVDTQVSSVVTRKDGNNRTSLRRKILITASVIVIVAAGVLGVRWYRDAAAQRGSASSTALAHQLAHVAGPGLDTVFAYGWQAKAGDIRLTAGTSFSYVCSAGALAIGNRQIACDGAVHTLGPLGRAGQVLVVSMPGSPWAFLARPENSSEPSSAPSAAAK
jgi:hypothetical protein